MYKTRAEFITYYLNNIRTLKLMLAPLVYTYMRANGQPVTQGGVAGNSRCPNIVGTSVPNLN